MFKHIGIALLGAATAALGASMPPVAVQNDLMKLADALAPGEGFRRRRGKGENNRRGKGKVSRPKRRRNMQTVGKRVRRKHRRAA